MSHLSKYDNDLFQAVSNGNYDMVKSAITNGASVNIFNNFGISVLLMAINAKFTENKINIIKKLLENGADPKCLTVCDLCSELDNDMYGSLPIIEIICRLPDVKHHVVEYAKLIKILLNKYQCCIGGAYDYARNRGLVDIMKVIMTYSKEIKLFYPRIMTRAEAVDFMISAYKT